MMTKCPGCNATLPDGAQRCQFCGAQFTAAPQSPQHGLARTINATDAWGKPKWVWPAYYAVAGWWVLDGVVGVLNSGHTGAIGMVFGALSAVIGIGLLARVEFVRGLVNIMCFLQILDGLWVLGVGFLTTGLLGIWGVLIMILAVVRIAMAVLMIFLIGETEARAPNF